ncbi:hypothetical protein LOAG_17516 [Loa loa]|uniref:acid phosphatase n=1 Tax=Loa loa TaxID=7209 RepID=A0A1S0UIN5_LOALO|nr:hypothetical protein LOAG_17516 [Loa loa]EJD75311.1 hypothetical protein LOAG_17516 [Loa loa]
MLTVVTDPAESNHQKLSHEGGNNNEMLSRTINKPKVYPLEESVHLEFRNDHVNEKVLPLEPEESRKDGVVPKQGKSFFRRNFKQALTLSAAIITIVLSLIAATVYYILSYSRPELIYTNMIWRHGDRAPVHYFPNFTEKYMVAFPRGIGYLTKIGAEQAKYLGLLLQRRYIHSRNITSKQIYIRSTNVSRTIETAKYVLEGMSFPHTRINVESATNVDTAGNPFFDCPVANQFVLDHKEDYFLRENFSEVYELMQQKLNYDNEPYALFDTLNCLKTHDLVLPDWLKSKELYENLKFLSWRGIEVQFGMGPYSNELQRKIREGFDILKFAFKGGSSLRGIVSRIACKVNYFKWTPVDACEERFSFQHDVTIAALLSTFNDIYSILGKSPLIGFGANIAFEIWRIDNSYEMKVWFIRFIAVARK